MKVIVCFDTTRITVPCGNGELIVKDLVDEAVLRYKRAMGKGPKVKIRVHTVKSVTDGAILDFNDQIVAVVDDREQIIALFEEEEEDELDVPLHGSDGMSASSGSTDTWRPDSENSLTINGPRNPPLLNPNQRWHLERSGLIDDDENGIEIKEDDVNFRSDLALSVRHGSDSALENQRDGTDTLPLTPHNQSQLKRWSTAAAVYYSDAPEAVRNKIIIPLPVQTNPPATQPQRREPLKQSANSDLSPAIAAAPHDKWPITSQLKSNVTNAVSRPPPASQEAREEETVVSVVPRKGEPLGLHLVPVNRTHGLLIQAIDVNSVAESCGKLHLNDRIVEVNGQDVEGLDFQRAQEVLRSAVAQGEAVKIRVSSAVAQTSAATLISSSSSSTASSVSPSATSDTTADDRQSVQQQQHHYHQQQDSLDARRKRTPPPLPPKPKLPADLETMLLRANYEAGLDYTPDATADQADHLYTYGSIRRPGRKLTIDLLKGSDGLGFTVTTRDNAAGTICPIYVKSILPKGAAFKDGRLKSGDRLIEVNGTDLAGKSQDEVVNLLRGIPLNTDVILIVARPETTASPVLPRLLDGTSQSLQSDNSQEALEKNKEILTFDIPLNDSGSAGLGVRVTGKTKLAGDPDSDGPLLDCGIFVMNVISGGAASKDGRLMPMDQLLNVDGVSLLGKNNVDAMETLKSAMLEHGKSSPCMSITVAREMLPTSQTRALPQLSSAVPQTNPTELHHIIRVPSQLNISPSPNSDISPPKPPRLYQNGSASQSSSTIAGGKADPVLIEGDDSFADVSPRTATSSSSTVLTHRRLDDIRDPYDADSSISESDPFNREGFARQSMSEKRHAHLDPRSLETYRRSKAALAEARVGGVVKSHTPSPSHAPTDSSELRRANSLESVVVGPTGTSNGGSEGKRRTKAGSAGRNRGCNESFRVAVDRSYDPERGDEDAEERIPSPNKPRSHSKEEHIEVLGSPDDGAKKQTKKPGFLQGWLRRSSKKEDSPTKVTSNVQVTRSTKPDDQASKARQEYREEQQRINMHFQKFKKEAQLQKQQETTGISHSHTSSDVRIPPKRSQPLSGEQRPMIVHVPSQGKNQKQPIPLNGTNSFVTNDPYGHYMNYDEIQKVMKRPAIVSHNQHHQAMPSMQRQRPVSYNFEYEPPSVGGINHNVRLGSGIYAQIGRPLGQIREISQEKIPSRSGPSENIYSAVRRSGTTPVVTPTAAAMMGSQV